MPISKGSSAFCTRYCADPWQISIVRFHIEKYSMNEAISRVSAFKKKNFIFILYTHIHPLNDDTPSDIYFS